MVSSEATSTHCGGVAVLYRVTEHFSVEALWIYGVNVVRFQLASGGRWWFIMGCYLAPDYVLTIEDFVADISQRPRGDTLLVVGNFNTNLAASEGQA